MTTTTLIRLCFLAGLSFCFTSTAVCKEPSDGFFLPKSTSPDGRYAVAIRWIASESGEPTDDSPSADKSPFLVKVNPYHVICEVRKSFRDSGTHPENDFEVYWKKDSSMVAIVYMEKHASSVTVLERRAKHWHRLPIPAYDVAYDDRLIARVIPNAGQETDIRPQRYLFIESVSFGSKSVQVNMWFEVLLPSDAWKDVTIPITYRLERHHRPWVRRAGAITVD
jgi:hypothetical protein